MPKIAEVKAQVERIWLATFQSSLAETVTQQVRQHALAGVQAALETALVEELKAYRSQWSTQQPALTVSVQGVPDGKSLGAGEPAQYAVMASTR
ncbi:MAG: hypothetical protein HGA45_43355 [Chloroflexales bacterium]|nr:hypothetical protein [Chloroflexales bacterium]